MKLIDLNPNYVTMPVRAEHWTHKATNEGPVGAGGIEFDCPQCTLHPEQDEWRVNSKGRMHHRISVFVPEAFDQDPKIGPGRWSLVGNDFSDLSLRAGSNSVRCQYGCRAHFSINTGVIEMHSDSGQ